MKRTNTISLDTDWLWRKVGNGIIRGIQNGLAALAKLTELPRKGVQNASKAMTVNYLGQPHTADSEERSVFGRSWQIGTTALWIALLLSIYILVYYR